MHRKGLDLPGLLAECADGGMAAVFDIGVTPEDLPGRLRLASSATASRPLQIVQTCGLHPGSVTAEWRAAIERLERALHDTSPKLVAVGEIGLDYYRDTTRAATQREAFDAQLALAARHNLPVVIHNRSADTDMIDALRRRRPAGVMHCFSQDAAFAQSCLDLGLYISFAGNVTYRTSTTIQEAVRVVPADRLLVETDAPYLSPQTVRGRPNHPGHLGFTIRFLAELLNQPPEALAAGTAANARALFGL